MKPSISPLLLCMIALGGCIPSEPPPPPVLPPETEETAEPEPEPAPLPAPPAGQSGIPLSRPNHPNVGARVVPLENGTYSVEGQLGTEGKATLTGTIRKQENGKWLFEGAYEFPTGGYEFDQPTALPLSIMVLDNGNPQLKDGDGTVVLNFPVKAPPADAMVTKAIVTEPLRFEFDAPEKPKFTVMFSGKV